MKRRTRVTAWVFALLGVQSAIQMWNVPTIAQFDRVFIVTAGLAVAMCWILVLMKKQWARNASIGVVGLQFVGIMHNAWAVPSPEPMWKIMAIVGGLAAMFAGWQLFVLLTEKPEQWAEEAR